MQWCEMGAFYPASFVAEKVEKGLANAGIPHDWLQAGSS